MLFSPAALLTILASCSLASATFSRHQPYSWGCDKDTKDRAPKPVKDDCSSRGSFFTSYNGKAVCCSDKTRTNPPKPDLCPHKWSWNNRPGCCIPPKEVCEKDCGEGYYFNKITMRCDRKEVNKCGRGKWWHERNKECCDDDYTPDKGECPKGKKCPKDWHWSKKGKRCKPDKPRSPEPDCDDWDDHNGCCGGPPPPPGPSPKPPTHPGPGNGGGNGGGHGNGGGNGGGNGHGNNGGGHGGGNGHHKRNVDLRRASQLAFPQTETDKMYCPGNLHACSVNPTFGGEWAYECIDFATELESCGGCSSTGEGQDCTKIPNAVSVGCELGVCAVYSCQSGFAANGTSCALA